MSHYSENPASVRVDFFKSNGKWYCTESIIYYDYNGEFHLAFAKALIIHLKQPDGTIRLNEMVAVCLEPYHHQAHPVMKTVAQCIKLVDTLDKVPIT